MSLARIHQKLGTAGFIISIVALVAALGGGAYAAAGSLTGKQKKEVQKIAKAEAEKLAKVGPAGPSGPAGGKGDAGSQGNPGVQGTQGVPGEKGATGDPGTSGPAGPVGATGATGATGAAGAPGPSPTVVPLPASAPGPCAGLGGFKIVGVIQPDGEEATACNGAAGTGGGGGFPKTLPSGSSETGFWEVQGEHGVTLGDLAVSTISFVVPLATPPADTVLVAVTPTPEEEAKCPGSEGEPEAAAGELCLYPFVGPPTLGGAVPFTFGTELFFAKTDEAFGSWAVTAQ